jgi:hypothetical protein
MLKLDTLHYSPEGDTMRDLTIHDLDAQLAEQLPARELMGSVAVALTTGTSTIYAYKSIVAGSGNVLGIAIAINVPINITA